MALGADLRHVRAIVVAATLLSACAIDAPGTPTPDPSLSAPREPASTAPSPSPSPAASATATPSAGLALPEPDRPFDGATLLDAMRTSRRPGGVPDQLETEAVASAVADAIWTYGGEPWTAMAIGGSCGPQTCSLEVAGTRSGTIGEDLWVFEVTPGTGAVQVVSADLRSLPSDLPTRLDTLARALLPAANFEGLILTNVRWLPPPDDAQFVLSYRSGEEELSSCGMDITLDAAVPGVVSRLFIDC